jgi:hypothetical protein
MQTGLQAEVLLCPNCKEEVPKTLYCLNCGYPLYKIDLDQPEEDVEVVVDEALEPVEDEAIVKVETIEDVVIMVEDMAASPAEETKEAEPEDETELVEAVVPVEITEFVAEAEPVVEVEAVPEVVEEIIEPVVEVEAVPEVVEEIIEPVVEVEAVPEVVEEATEPVVEVVEPLAEDVLEIPLEESVESVEASVFEVVGGPEIEDVEKVEEAEPIIEIVDVTKPSYEPEPVIREIMENFSKNISMKIRLVGLLRDGGVKVGIFERLFESYVARGELLMNSRSKMLERVNYDLGSMERALNEAKAGLEELEIRRAISDVSDEEYAAKAPGFEWDIGQYEDEVGRKKAEIAYLEDITRVMSEEEITELIEIGEGCLDFVESDEMGSEMAGRVKISLEEALSCLRA